MTTLQDRWSLSTELQDSGFDPYQSEALLIVADDLISDTDHTYADAYKAIMKDDRMIQLTRDVHNQIRPSRGFLKSAGGAIVRRVKNIPPAIYEAATKFPADQDFTFMSAESKLKSAIMSGLGWEQKPMPTFETQFDLPDWLTKFEKAPEMKGLAEPAGEMAGSLAALLLEAYALKKVPGIRKSTGSAGFVDDAGKILKVASGPARTKLISVLGKRVAQGAMEDAALFALDEKLSEGHVTHDAVAAGLIFGGLRPFKTAIRVPAAAILRGIEGKVTGEDWSTVGVNSALFAGFALLGPKKGDQLFNTMLEKASMNPNKVLIPKVTRWASEVYLKDGRWPSVAELMKRYPDLKFDDNLGRVMLEHLTRLKESGAHERWAAEMVALRRTRPMVTSGPEYATWRRQVNALGAEVKSKGKIDPDALQKSLASEERHIALHDTIRSLPTAPEVKVQEELFRKEFAARKGTQPELTDLQFTQIAFERAREIKVARAAKDSPHAYRQWWTETYNKRDVREAREALLSESKVRLEDTGELIRVYHGTDVGFEKFDVRRATSEGLLGTGLYHTENPEVASRAAGIGRGANIRSSYLDIRNPLDLNSPAGKKFQTLFGAVDEPQLFNNAVKASGYDGFVYSSGRGRIWVAFNESQVYPAYESATQALEGGIRQITKDPQLQRIASRARWLGRDAFLEEIEGTAESVSTFVLKPTKRVGVGTQYEIIGKDFQSKGFLAEAELEIMVRSANVQGQLAAGERNLILTAPTGELEKAGLSPMHVAQKVGARPYLEAEANYLKEKGFTAKTFFEASDHYRREVEFRNQALTSEEFVVLLGTRFGPEEQVLALSHTPKQTRSLDNFAKELGTVPSVMEAALSSAPHTSPTVAAHEFTFSRGVATPLKPTLKGFKIKTSVLDTISALRPEMSSIRIRGRRGRAGRIIVFGPLESTTEALHSLPSMVYEPKATIAAKPKVQVKKGPLVAVQKVQKVEKPAVVGLYANDPAAKKSRTFLHRNEEPLLRKLMSNKEATLQIARLTKSVFPNAANGLRDLNSREVQHMRLVVREYAAAMKQGREKGFTSQTYKELVKEKNDSIKLRESKGESIPPVEKQAQRRTLAVQRKDGIDIPTDGPVDAISPYPNESLAEIIRPMSGRDWYRPVNRVLDDTHILSRVLEQDTAQLTFTTHYSTRARDILQPILKRGRKSRDTRERIGWLLDNEESNFGRFAGTRVHDLGQITSSDIQMATEIRALWNELAIQFDIPPERQITTYLHHMFDRRFRGRVDQGTLQWLPKQLVAGFKRERITGEGGYVLDIANVLDSYIHFGARDKFMNPLLKEFGFGSEWMKAQRGKSGHSSAVRYVDTYLKDLVGLPTEGHERSAVGMKQLIEITGMRKWFERQNPGMSEGELLQLSDEMARTLTQLSRDVIYAGGLGLRPGSALKNLTQSISTIGEVGLIPYFRGGLGRYSTEAGQKLIQDAKILREFAPNMYKQPAVTTGAMRAALNKSFFMFEMADRFNRGTAFLAAYDRFMQTGGKFNRKSSLKSAQRKIDALLMEEKTHEAAIEYGRDVVARTQYIYSRTNTPTAFRSPTGQVMGIFLTWPINFVELINDWTVKGGFANVHKLARYLAVAGSVAYAGNQIFDTNISNWFLAGSLPRSIPVGLQAPIDAYLLSTALLQKTWSDVTGGESKYDAREVKRITSKYWDSRANRPGNSAWIYMPLGLEIRGIDRAWSAYEDGEDAEIILHHLVGLKPKKR